LRGRSRPCDCPDPFTVRLIRLLIADARPRLVKAIVAIEPAGPPFEATIIGTGKARAWGLSDVPITYDPAIKEPGELAVEREAKADSPDLFVCWMQKAPARQLINLKNIPVVVMAAEASRVLPKSRARYCRKRRTHV
jgi:hypothetical protein